MELSLTEKEKLTRKKPKKSGTKDLPQKEKQILQNRKSLGGLTERMV